MSRPNRVDPKPPSRLQALFKGVAWAALFGLGLAPLARGVIFTPPYEGMRVKVLRFDHSAFPTVDMYFRLETHHKTNLRDLHEANLRLIEEEVEVQDTRLEMDFPPLSIAMVIDDSGSVDPELEYTKLATTRFIDQLHRLDEMAVVSFDRHARILQDRTSNKRLLKNAVGKLRGYGATAVYDGAVLGFDAIRDGAGEKKMLLLSDGNDQVYYQGRKLSLETAGDLIQRAQREGVEIYTIALGSHADQKVLKHIADKTGGMCWYAPSPRHLREVFDALALSITATYRLRYTSPNTRREKQDRTVTLDVEYQRHQGRGVGTYWIDREIPVLKLPVERKRVAGAGLGKLRVFTRGIRGKFLEIEFALLCKNGEIAKAGRTTTDGFGRVDRLQKALLTGLKPGIYDLEFKLPGQEVRFLQPDIRIFGGETTSRTVSFSRLVFHRKGEPWYDIPHPYGPTSDLIRVKIQDALGRVYKGKAKKKSMIVNDRLSTLTRNREVGLWLPEGLFDIQLENLWKDSDPAVDEGLVAPLVNQLKSQIQVLGGRELVFNVEEKDLAEEEDVLSPEYIAANLDENPFIQERPETAHELEYAIARQRGQYLQGRFTRHDAQAVSDTKLYRYRSRDEIRAKLRELEDRYDGPEDPVREDLDPTEALAPQDQLSLEERKKRLDEIASFYLTEANPSFPDHAGATKEFRGGPGDRYDGVREMRQDHRQARVQGEVIPSRSQEDNLYRLRERAGLRDDVVRPHAEATVEVDGVSRSITDLTDRVRARMRGAFPSPPPPSRLHNLGR